MTETRQDTALAPNQVSTKRGFPVYRTNPSVPVAGGLATRTKRIHVPGGNAAVIVDHSSGEIKGLGGMGFWWDEEVDKTRFVKLFLDGIKQAAGLSKTGATGHQLNFFYESVKETRFSSRSILQTFDQAADHPRDNLKPFFQRQCQRFVSNPSS